jgi:hypothetical protein
MNKLLTYHKEREQIKVIGKNLIGLSTNPIINWMDAVIYLRTLRQKIDEVIKSLEKEPS